MLFRGLYCWALSAALVAAPAAGADSLRAALELRAEYAAELEKLARWCTENGLRAEAQTTRRLIVPIDPYKLYVPTLPAAVGPPKLPDNAPPAVVQWDARLWQLRREHAGKLFEMARRAVRNGQAGLAFEMALAALQANPDHEAARRVFGFQKYKDQWRSLDEIRRLRAGQVWSEKFGWLPKAHLPRYEKGERYFNGRWISAAEDAKLHADIQSGWDIESEHYLVRTNHSLEAAVGLIEKLERLHRVWRLLFIRYYATPESLAALFEGRARAALPSFPRHHVVLFRDREDYIRALQPAMPKIDISSGVYVEQTRRAYFFVAEEPDDRTMYHEATHQLFHELRPTAPNVARKANFWIIEGIAMYMESLHSEEGYEVLGGLDDERMRAACYRLLQDGFYVPLEEFVSYGMERWQNDLRIATLYSQAAGLTHFLVHYDSGRYREALLRYLLAVYEGRDQLDTLAQLTGVSYAELDEQYREFIEAEKMPVKKN